MPYGYNGKILHVNLSSATLTIEEPSEEFYRKYMGGSALNIYYLLKEMAPGIDPLGPENILALSVSAVTGVSISGQSRLTASAKSPLTAAIGDSQSGGFWPAELKFAGFDAIIIKGKSPSPAYLWIHDGKAELCDATPMWGQFTGDAEKAIRVELNDPKIKVLQIGPAGENQVRFASLINNCNRANGRTGMGAVMGSKNLKAIAVRGTQRPALADKEAFKSLARRGANDFPASMIAAMGKYGTAGAVSGNQSLGGLPSYNFNSGVFENWEKISAKTMYNTIRRGCEEGQQQKYGRDTCFGCIVHCKPVVEIKKGPFAVSPTYGGPEYETLAAFGSYCGIDDLAAIAKANEICNQYGMDTISCGATIAWAMEAFECGGFTLEDTGGLELKFGNAAAMVKLAEMIGQRQGFGNVLAEGSARAAERLGCGAEFLVTIKGQEAPAHMPHLKRSLALIYAVNPFGADHQSSEHDPAYEDHFKYFKQRLESLKLREPQAPQSLSPEKITFARKTQYFYSMLDSLNLCQFVYGPSWQLYGPQEIMELVQAVTGWDVTIDELMTLGERRLNMMRVFNAREGINRDQDQLPVKFYQRPLKGGPTDGWKIDNSEFEAALEEYYRQCGWDIGSGAPMRKTLQRLGIDWMPDNL
ncbi:MAG: aldehyde ferredoxin oxidoreductase family protein [Desulfobacterales bacterium]|jgi:aldehyde:ferredoxin oxidoreductase